MSINILITGASSGIGFQAAVQLINNGYKIIAPCRNKEKSYSTYELLKKECISDIDIDDYLELPAVDLSSLNEIKEFSEQLLLKGSTIDILILNAGLQYTGSRKPRWSKDGVELTFAVNHLAHQYLTQLISSLYEKSKSPRVIITSSEVHNPKAPGGRVGKQANLGELGGLKNGKGFEMIDGDKIFNADKAYKDTKLCNILFARELYKRSLKKGNKINVTAWAPGLVIPNNNGGFFRYSRKYNQLGQILFSFIARDLLSITESTENAGKLLYYLATSTDFEEPSFRYMSNTLIRPGQKLFRETEISIEASNNILAKELWELTDDLIKTQ